MADCTGYKAPKTSTTTTPGDDHRTEHDHDAGNLQHRVSSS